jgi:hypothetical protein
MQNAIHHDVKYLKVSVLTSWIECTNRIWDRGHLWGQFPQKTPKGETPAKSSYGNRTGDTEPAPVNRFAHAVTQTTWFVIGQTVTGTEHSAVSFVPREP